MNLVTFRQIFPEAATCPDALINPFLAMAEKAIDPEVYGDRFDEAHGYLTMHLLAVSPYGKTARLESDKGKSTYGNRYEAVRLECTVGFRVI